MAEFLAYLKRVIEELDKTDPQPDTPLFKSFIDDVADGFERRITPDDMARALNEKYGP